MILLQEIRRNDQRIKDAFLGRNTLTNTRNDEDGGGTALICDSEILIASNSTVEQDIICSSLLIRGESVWIFNIYKAPIKSNYILKQWIHKRMSELRESTTNPHIIIAGDFNIHPNNSFWEEIGELTGLKCLSPEAPTWRRGMRNSVVDYVLHSDNISVTEEPTTFSSSDHRPLSLIIRLERTHKREITTSFPSKTVAAQVAQQYRVCPIDDPQLWLKNANRLIKENIGRIWRRMKEKYLLKKNEEESTAGGLSSFMHGSRECNR